MQNNINIHLLQRDTSAPPPPPLLTIYIHPYMLCYAVTMAVYCVAVFSVGLLFINFIARS